MKQQKEESLRLDVRVKFVETAKRVLSENGKTINPLAIERAIAKGIETARAEGENVNDYFTFIISLYEND